jgi:hypothetical protein
LRAFTKSWGGNLFLKHLLEETCTRKLAFLNDIWSINFQLDAGGGKVRWKVRCPTSRFVFDARHRGRHPRITSEHFIGCLRHHTKCYPHRERHPRITPEHFIVCLRHHTKSYPHRERHPRLTIEHLLCCTAPTPRTRPSSLSFIVFHGATQSVTLQHETKTLFLVLRTPQHQVLKSATQSAS